VRLLADTNIVAQAVRSLRDAGHDVVYAAEFAVDPGDESLLAQAVRENRVFLERLQPDWKIASVRRAAPGCCLQSICISLKMPASIERFQSG
jgi:predicted nuclease of predicted toxin-antitoxin system